MKKIIFSFFTILTLLVSVAVNAQKLTPAKWSWALSKPNPAVGETVDIVFTVKIDKDWYLYSSDFDPDLGPIVTTIKFKANDSYATVGGLKAINPHKKFDKEIWNGEYTYFKEKGEFRQSVKILKTDIVIEGVYDSQTCTDKTGQCVPIKGPFKLEAKAGADNVSAKKKVK
ncbi:Disulphide bond corrector protein DsbC [Pseudarcicella hirudinis]|uniref:Disulphide bond corrector protein DsbC n=1 Tax=Pseudarcicella hirudinis TaxID=1079859 RepID=A0A1I5QQ84_9BACT|nr:protein-disulfide reductase DsbD domain-containing protein [Pseudarcicella hirudinis]SFP48171.1 Disulphide bond corrector protein DsbC [Pseudarcicella hirudinis]